MLKQRIITAVLLAPLVLLTIWYGTSLVFGLFSAFLVLMIGFEWCQLAKQNMLNSVIIASVLALITFFINYHHSVEIDAVRILVASSILWLMAFIWIKKPEQGKQKSMIKYAFGIGVLLLFGSALMSVHEILQYGPGLTLALFLLVWVADIGAYIAGKSFGKHKLAPQVSPGKTIEGMMGALILTAIFGYTVAHFLDQKIWPFMVFFPLIAAISVVGDLFASLLKRHASIKDSGFLLPGHGGFLDRFDSLIAAAPFYYGFIHFFFRA